MAIDFDLLDYGDSRIGIRTNNVIVKVHRNATNVSTVYVINAESTIDVGDTDAVLTSNQSVYLEKGSWLYFETKGIVLAESKIIGTTPTSIAIYESVFEILANEKANTYGLITLPTSEMENSESVGTVDAKTHKYGEQGAMERVSRVFEPTIGLIIEPGDIGYFYHVLPAALNKAGYNGTVTVFMAIPGNNADYEYTFGNALIKIDEDSNVIDEIRRPKVTFLFQYPWLKTTILDAESN